MVRGHHDQNCSGEGAGGDGGGTDDVHEKARFSGKDSQTALRQTAINNQAKRVLICRTGTLGLGAALDSVDVSTLPGVDTVLQIVYTFALCDVLQHNCEAAGSPRGGSIFPRAIRLRLGDGESRRHPASGCRV